MKKILFTIAISFLVGLSILATNGHAQSLDGDIDDITQNTVTGYRIVELHVYNRPGDKFVEVTREGRDSSGNLYPLAYTERTEWRSGDFNTFAGHLDVTAIKTMVETTPSTEE